MFLLTIYVTVAIGVSFICSVLEAVLLSLTPSYLAQLRQQSHPSAEKLAQLKGDIDRPLASILTLNTIAHTIGAASAVRKPPLSLAASGWGFLCRADARYSGVV